eukprot:Blabericola_migrator_1__3395@NODE_1_length_33786_cov_123_788665_g0_i0_p7_GENE_NODE_1_length_33786_cov_123_788665_g0_i0NODE_1_length_33786_cov_123_788665_g0_i0_p7_ORF_typecomplete_len406_score66_19WD40/PF00400_32/1_1e02WD40/PF00400_32/4_6e09ANAPC4_WD40/PF12894_7/7_1e08ANAPC4_WD40/PF12894_7/1_3e04CRT10/PF08728_10/7_7e07Nup160/PF11715_8/4_2e06Nbas_N/PF15492_6/0_0006Ge1_WD40/PF16529_5/0_004eIF2A/PF08662_11/0_075GCIP/PF13324_6/0_18WD40_like/PF17005_5/0_22Sigma70_ner/PF04546_13/1_8e03Sigma70_ner/PF045
MDNSIWGLDFHPYNPSRFVVSSNVHMAMTVDMTDLPDDTNEVFPQMSNCKPFIGHADNIPCVKYSPNGTLLATVSIDKTVRVWSASSGKELCEASLGSQWGWSVKWLPKASIKSAEVWTGCQGDWERQLREVVEDVRETDKKSRTPSSSSFESAESQGEVVHTQQSRHGRFEGQLSPHLSQANDLLVEEKVVLTNYMLHEPWKTSMTWKTNPFGELEWTSTLSPKSPLDLEALRCSVTRALHHQMECTCCNRRSENHSGSHTRIAVNDILQLLVSRINAFDQISRGLVVSPLSGGPQVIRLLDGVEPQRTTSIRSVSVRWQENAATASPSADEEEEDEGGMDDNGDMGDDDEDDDDGAMVDDSTVMDDFLMRVQSVLRFLRLAFLSEDAFFRWNLIQDPTPKQDT